MSQSSNAIFDEAAAVEAAYLALLRMPHGESRMRLQKVLAALRDEIAFLKGEFPQDVQDRCDALAALKPFLGGCVTTRDATLAECIMNIRKHYIADSSSAHAEGWNEGVGSCEDSLKGMLPPELRSLKAFDNASPDKGGE